LYLRFTDKQLDEMTKKVLQSGSNPDDWLAKLNKSMTTKPTLKALRELLREGQEHNVPQYHLDTLRDYIETVDNWTNDAERLLLNKSESKPTTKRRDQRVRDLIEQATQIGFDMPHLDQLVEYSQKLDTFNNKLTDEVLSSTDKELQMQLYQQGLQLRADSIKFNQLKNSLESCSWEEQVEKAVKQPFSQKVFKKLIKDAEDLGKTEESEPWLKRLIIMEENGRDILQRVENICKGKDKIVFDEEESILHMGENTQDPNLSIILDTTIINRLKNAMGRSKNVLSEIENMLLNASNKPNVMDRPSLTEAQRLMSMCRELSFKSDLIPQLSNALTQMGAWNDQLRSTFMNGRQKSLETVIRESLSNVERITSSEATAGIWCICRRVESGLMIECDICREWYHSSCLKVPRNVVRSSTNYVCPVCHNSDQRARITHLSRQPKLEEIADLVNNAQPLKFKPKDYNLINAIHTTMQAYKGKVRAFCRSKTQLGMEDVGMIKHYLRTLMGLEISLQDETEFLRTKIQKLMPITPTPNQTTGTGLPAASNSVESTSAVKPASASSSKVVVENDDAATGATAPATTTPEHRRLTTTVRPLSNNHHQLLPQQSSNCICQQQKNMDDSISKCPHCTGTAGPSSAETRKYL
jgi:histone demethylase JARID1